MLLQPFFETLGVPYLPRYDLKRIEVNRIKIGVLIELLEPVKHFKRALKPTFSKATKPSVIQMKSQQQVVDVNFRSVKFSNVAKAQ